MYKLSYLIWFSLSCSLFNSIAISKVSSEKIIFLSDTQDPLWIEKIILSENFNIEASNLILNQVVEERASAVFHLGDLVSIGFDPEAWHRIDRFLTHLKSYQIPFYPTLGNHELLLFPEQGTNEFMRRFPAYQPTGYTVRVGRVAIIILNSNFGYLDDLQKNKQQVWYEHVLDSCQQDSSIRAIIVGCHHSPFTNSMIVASNRDVQNYFLPGFTTTPKTKLFLAGHAHAFEHFHDQGKDFMVIGGGGGLQHPLAFGNRAEFRDLSDGSAKRQFHYLSIMPSDSSIALMIHMVKADLSGFEVGYQLEILY